MNHRIVRLAELRVPIAAARLTSKPTADSALVEWGARVPVCPVCGGQHVHWTGYSNKETALYLLNGRRAACVHGRPGFDSYIVVVTRTAPTGGAHFGEPLRGWGRPIEHSE